MVLFIDGGIYRKLLRILKNASHFWTAEILMGFFLLI
jgi:hypothetical protein